MAYKMISESLEKLKKSQFRARFRLSEKDKAYISEKGLDTIRSHACDFISRRLAPSVIPNDGKQTPMRGHPVFLAQHACACCCRGCLYKWYHIPQNKQLEEHEQEEIVELLMAWITAQL